LEWFDLKKTLQKEKTYIYEYVLLELKKDCKW